ncbi:hypothetical protein MRX96_046829 [Rhipicephalus microplus]
MLTNHMARRGGTMEWMGLSARSPTPSRITAHRVCARGRVTLKWYEQMLHSSVLRRESHSSRHSLWTSPMLPLQLHGDSRRPAREPRKHMRHMGDSPMLDVSSALSEPSCALPPPLPDRDEASSGRPSDDAMAAPVPLSARLVASLGQSDPGPAEG